MMRTLNAAALLFALGLVLSPAAGAQTVEAVEDSVRVSFIDTDLRAAIQALSRYLDKPILAEPIGEVRVELFETPRPVPREVVPTIVQGLVEANGLLFEEDDDFYRISVPAPEEPEEVPVDPASANPDAVRYRLFTIRLRHARAEDVAATLNQLYGAGTDFSRPAGLSGSSLSDQLRADREGREEEQVPREEGATLASAVTIVPDASTNSLLIRSTQADFDVLEEGVTQLDVRPLQVLIEVIVVEARKDRQFSLGFDVSLPEQNVDGATVAGDLVAGGLGDLVVRVMGLAKADINVALSAARLRGDVEIVSRPVILASNNVEANLLVGTQQPFVQVSRSLPTDTPQRDQVVQYRDVGTKLTVRPTINQDGYVSLFVQQELSSATGDIQFNAPVISSREATTQVLVANRQTIVIGGLRDTVTDEVRSGIPLLADVPLLGGLFGSTRTRNTETEIFLFITPTIITNDSDMAIATIERVPQRLIDQDFITGRPISVPVIPTCDPNDPECGS
ncbi:MAG: secretin N-terminal domain-containing protein [Gemmatimonadota bacterium]